MAEITQNSPVEVPADIKLDVREFASSFMRELKEVDSHTRAVNEQCCIFRVPLNLREKDSTAYDPMIVSIGPYHRRKEHLIMMERRKQIIARGILHETPSDVIDKCFKKVRDLEKQARSYYEDDIDMQSEDFLKMMILDGLFIVVVLLCLRLNDDENWKKIMGRERTETNVEAWAGSCGTSYSGRMG
ncbi:hypothetical protein QJS04_geneDACA023539 [Acorus gramineus]|uniref:Uncharacterized protein n=1 Tax=Acorus gramineus TaxID=55184 RepID=A0AAV9BAE1_ACOGR|nr:hypothetical protein QJS04_geneDACA023539 [Acorus gramineus]